MPGISSPYQQHRQTTGSHLNWHYRNQESQQSQNLRVKKMASQPGLHTGNVDMQNATHAFVQLLSVLSIAQSSNAHFAITSERADDMVIKNRLLHADTLYRHQRIEPTVRREFHKKDNQEAGQRAKRSAQSASDRESVQAPDRSTHRTGKNAKHEVGTQILTRDRRAQPSDSGSAVATAATNTAVNRLPPLVNNSSAASQQGGQIAPQGLPLSVPPDHAASRVQAFIDDVDIVSTDGEMIDKTRYFYQIFQDEGGTISRKKIQPVEQFYEKIRNKCPNLKKVASDLLRAEIKKKFHMDIDPDHTYFLHFDSAINDPNAFTGFAHSGKPAEERTLTECLFSNFPADAQDNPIAVDLQTGIYTADSTNETEFNGVNQVRIRPSDFMQLIWDIDFYNVAKASMDICWDKLIMHIASNAATFSMKLSENRHYLREEEVDYLLKGIGFIKNAGEVKVYPFDINGYEATDMLVFEMRDSGSRIIYMPRSKKNFAAFENEFEMRQWIINNCADEEHRNAIASHFSIANRQDGLFYYGVDAWLKSLENVADANKELEKICLNKRVFEANTPLLHMTFEQHARVFSDLDKIIKSNAKIKKELWMRFFDAGNSIAGNPITQFISLGFHIDKMVNGDTVEEKNLAWNQIVSDLVNLGLMAILDVITEGLRIDFDESGPEFISKIERDMSTFAKDRASAFDRVLPVDKFTLNNASTRIASTSRGISIKTTEGVLSKLDNLEKKVNINKLTLPDDRGISKILSDDGRKSEEVLKIGNKYFQITSLNDLGNYIIGGMNGVEVYFDKGVYLEKYSYSSQQIDYISCERGKRSPGTPCLHLSQDVHSILHANIEKGLLEKDIGNLSPEPKYPGIYRNFSNNKLYIQFNDVYFEVRFTNEMGFSVFAKQPDGFFHKFTPAFMRKITDVYFSPRNGRHFLTTEIEKSMEALNLSRPAAELHAIQEKYTAALTRDEIDSIHAYGRNNYDAINDFMRLGKPEEYLSPWIREPVLTQMEEIRSGLRKIPSYKGKIFRGTSIKESIFNHIQEGDIVTNKAFLSSSTDWNVAEMYRQEQHNMPGRKAVILELNVDKSGHPISQITFKLNEAEVLVEDETYFRVLKKSEGEIELEEIGGAEKSVQHERAIGFDV